MNDDGGTLGVAMFNPYPLIAARFLTRGPDTRIDRPFLTDRIQSALAMREDLFDTVAIAWFTRKPMACRG